MRTPEIAKLLGQGERNVTRLAYALGLASPIGSGNSHAWSPGDVLAMLTLVALNGPTGGEQYVEGALKCGEALDAGYPPAYLVTRGGTENVVVLESESPAQTDEMVAALLLQASDAGSAVRVVKLRPMVKALGPWLAELVDA